MNNINTKSLDLAAYIIYKTNKDLVEVKQNEDKINYFSIVKGDNTSKAYKEYRDSQIKKKPLPIADLHLFNHTIKLLKNMTRNLYKCHS